MLGIAILTMVTSSKDIKNPKTSENSTNHGFTGLPRKVRTGCDATGLLPVIVSAYFISITPSV